jgi:hypothetical protein
MDNDTPFSLFDKEKINKDLMSFIPNLLLIFSIGIIILFILYSIDNKCGLTPHGLFHFMGVSDIMTYDVNTKSCKTPEELNMIRRKQIENKVQITIPEPDKAIKDKDASWFALFGYIVTNAFKATLNSSNYIIRSLYDILNTDSNCCIGVVMLYIMFYIISKFFKEIIQAFVPFDFFKLFKNKKTKSSFLFDIIFSILSIISILFAVCLTVAIIVYIAFLFKGLFDSSNEYSVKLIPIYFMLIITIPLIAWIFGLDIKITEEKGASKKGIEKIGHYNWIIFMLIALGIPFITTCTTIVQLIVVGISRLLTAARETHLIQKRNCIWVYGWIILLVLFVMKIVMHILEQASSKLKIDVFSELINKLHIIF